MSKRGIILIAVGMMMAGTAFAAKLPRILAAGYWDTAITSYGGTLKLFAFCTDKIDYIPITFQGIDTGLGLYDDGKHGDGAASDGLFGNVLAVGAGLPQGARYLLELEFYPPDEERAKLWPVLNVPLTPRTLKPCDQCNGPVAYFDILNGTSKIPFPSNYFTRQDATSPTGLRLNFTNFNTAFMMPKEHINAIDGFSCFAEGMVAFSSPIDKSTLPTWQKSISLGSSVFLLNLDSLPSKPELVPILIQEDPLAVLPNSFYLQPVKPLKPKTTYAYVFTTDVCGINGECIRRDPDFEQFYADQPFADPLLERMRLEYQRLFNFLEGSVLNLHRSCIGLAFVFTTLSLFDDFLEISKQIETRGPFPLLEIEALKPLGPDGKLNPEVAAKLPPLPEDITIGGEGALVPLTELSYIIFGRYVSPDYRKKSGTYQGVFNYDQNGKPTYVEDVPLDFILALPKNETEMPFPVCVFVHGFTACKETLLAIADTLARCGIATIGIDLVGHGSRYSYGQFQCVDTFPIEFTNPLNFLASTGSFMQSVVDHYALMNMLLGLKDKDIDLLPDGHSDGKLDIDPQRIVLIGQSLGASMGATISITSPLINASVINVPAGGVTEMFLGMEGIPDIPREFLREYKIFAQTILDKGDPIGFAPFALKNPQGADPVPPTSVLIQECQDDEVVPNISTDNLARAFGVDHIKPILHEIWGLEVKEAPVAGNINGLTGGIYQWGPAEHTFLLLLDEEYPQDLRIRAQYQAAIFVRSYLDPQSDPVIIDPYNEQQLQEYLQKYFH